MSQATGAGALKYSFSKVMVVVLENTDYAAALRRPFLASLVQRGALLTDFTAEAHPSQPNYKARRRGRFFNADPTRENHLG